MIICIGNLTDLNLDGQPCENAYGYLTKERQVSQLVHFTPIDNIKGILELGLLPHRSVPESAVVIDTERHDGFPSCSCFSVTFPNYKMLYYRKQHCKYTFAVLGIDPRIIADKNIEDVLFFPCNAAKTGVCGANGTLGAKEMFKDKLTLRPDGKCWRAALSLPDNYTTNPQAEILIRGVVPAEYISCIYVEDCAARDELMQSLGGSCPKPVVINPEIFLGRSDNKYWRNY